MARVGVADSGVAGVGDENGRARSSRARGRGISSVGVDRAFAVGDAEGVRSLSSGSGKLSGLSKTDRVVADRENHGPVQVNGSSGGWAFADIAEDANARPAARKK